MCGRCWVWRSAMLSLLAAAAQAASKQTSLFLVHLRLLRIGLHQPWCRLGPRSAKLKPGGCLCPPWHLGVGHHSFGISRDCTIRLDWLSLGPGFQSWYLLFIRWKQRKCWPVVQDRVLIFLPSKYGYENKTNPFRQCGDWLKAQ